MYKLFIYTITRTREKKSCQGRMVQIMKFLCRVEEGQVTSFFETIDWLKKAILNAKDQQELEIYQTMLGQYESNLENIVIERG